MKTVVASDAKNKFGQTLEAALVEPVEITKSGRIVAYLISASEYRRLSRLDEEMLVSRAIEDEKDGYLSEQDTSDFLSSIEKMKK